MFFLAHLLALVGGVSLLAVVALTLMSVTGRSLVIIGMTPIPGDYEITQLLMAFSIFNFLPWCQLHQRHVSVNILNEHFPILLRNWLEMMSQLLMTLVTGIIAWQLWRGMNELREYQETSFILQFPIWWGYLAVLPAALFLPIVSGYSSYQTVVKMVQETQVAIQKKTVLNKKKHE